MRIKSKDDLIGALMSIRDCVERHYEYPVVAPNGKAEGLCLAVRGLKGLIKQLTESSTFDKIIEKK